MRNARRARLILTLLLLSAFTLITLDYRSGALGGVRKAASTVFGPIEDGVDHVVHPIGSWFSSLGHLGSYKHENEDLHRKVAELQTQLRMSAVERQEYLQEQKVLHLAGLGEFTSVAARVTAYGGALGFESTITINRGTNNGIRRNQTVISGAGLVGRVVGPVGPNSATVQLANDSAFTAGCRLSTARLAVGQVGGNGRGKTMGLTLLDNTVRLAVGQMLVTFSSGPGGFVPEVPIGKITHVTPANGQIAQTASVVPFVDFGSLDIVAVVVAAPKSIPHDKLLPTSPTPAPTVTVTVTASPGTPTSPSSTATTSSTPSTTPSSRANGASGTRSVTP